MPVTTDRLGFGDRLWVSFMNVVDSIVSFLPELLAAVLLIVVGWIVGKVVGMLVMRLLRAVRFAPSAKSICTHPQAPR